MFEKSLADVIRGIRANKNKEHDFITSSLNEARNEIKREDMDVKAKALQKVLYLSMLGYDMTWASFHVVEVMSASKFQHKRLGYLAAASSLQPDSEVLLLCVNLIKKDLASNSPYDVSLALSGLAAIINTDLARSLLPDLMAMMNHSRPYVRKRVTLLMYKEFLKYPDSLKQAFPRLREKLEDEDSGVVSAAVNVVCELANTNPKNYILLAPQLYTILTSSSNNWMLIKIVKLFGLLTPEEPRLARKLVGPLTNLISSTRAMSLLYECIHTVFTGGFLSPEVVGTLGNEVNQLATLCVTKLRGFVGDQDPNLKYLGLFLLLKLLPVNPKAVSEYRETILGCLDDPDVSIRLRALEIVTNIVTQKNIQDLVRRLLVHLMPRAPTNHKPVAAGKIRPPPVLDANYRMEVVRRILHLCTQDSYEMVTDFEWYADVLVDLVRFSGVSVGEDLAEKLLDLAVRVKGVRGYLVGTMRTLLTDTKLFESYGSAASNLPVLRAAAWICGEYPSFLTSPEETLLALCNPININALTPITKQLYLQAGLKLFFFWAGAPIVAPAESIFQPSPILGVLPILTAGELSPVARNAQRRVPIPEGLSLDQPIVQRPKAQLGADSLLVDFDSDLHEIEVTRKGKAGKSRKIKVKTEQEETPEQQAEVSVFGNVIRISLTRVS
ncbi:Adaptor protein complex AP-3 delta subunit [Gonapodya prolifera JEL478]|uniref:AP-3 complex subunit delta n=1 Tax=Gonapodya prolifera (strain JEL478) TaxID=1344416 RepID=A0A139AKL0_GONPJ|nr:Adaptor protein complex AP-3 delta subunit [Gonapodya prolifera JEL478]|eukprot:KXS16965.1 Adaptor protein complex AP-3 delta subunit [Gonapodya prolifera JEL478]